MTLIEHSSGNYRFLSGIAPYSCGVIAMPDFEIVHVKLRSPIPINETVFHLIEGHLSNLDRPVQALCAMELRIPSALSFEEFKEFNDSYQKILKDRGLLLGDVNPIARTNISPAEFDLNQASVYAFSYTVPIVDNFKGSSFIVAGAGDLADQTDLSTKAIVRPNEKSSDARQEKVKVVMKVMEDRLYGLKAHWSDVSSVSIYSKMPLQGLLVENILKPMEQAALQGVNWYYSTPPIKGLDYEMDMRGVRKEYITEL